MFQNNNYNNWTDYINDLVSIDKVPIICVMSLLNLKSRNIVCSVSLLPDINTCNLDQLILSCNDYHIFYIKSSFNDLNFEKITVHNTIVFMINLKQLIVLFNQGILTGKKYSNCIVNVENSIFIFIDYEWCDIVNTFKENFLYISGGHTTKRHIISSTDWRLCGILDKLNISLDYTIKSYHDGKQLLTTKKNISNGDFNKSRFSKKYSTLVNKNMLNINNWFYSSIKLNWILPFYSNWSIKEIKALDDKYLINILNELIQELDDKIYLLFFITVIDDRIFNITKCIKLSKYSDINYLIDNIKIDIGLFNISYSIENMSLENLYIKYRVFHDLNLISNNKRKIISTNPELRSKEINILNKYFPTPNYSSIDNILGKIILKEYDLGIIKTKYLYSKYDGIIIDKIEYSSNFIKFVFYKNNKIICEFSEQKLKDSYIRTIKNNIIYYDLLGNLIKIEKNIPVNFILKGKDQTIIKNNKILTFDIESYLDINNNFIPFACGFYDGNQCYINYLTDFNNFNDMIEKMFINIISKYHSYIVYVHNLRNFDEIFIINSLTKNFIIKPMYKDSKLYSIKISKKINNKTHILYLLDSYLLLPQSLKKLGKTFNVSTLKDIFPYKFVNEFNLNYIGLKPDIKYYDNILLDKYNEIPSTFNLKKNLIKYLEKDLISLYEVIIVMRDKIFNDFWLNITDFSTLSSLAMGIFRNIFYKNENIPILKGKISKDIRKSYYGGRTEVFKPLLYNGYAYDINSLYSTAMLNDMPIGIPKLSNDTNLDNYFGFVYANIETPSNSHIGLLPYKNEKGILYFPLGKFSGWWFSEELKYVIKYNYKIKIIKGYKFDWGKNIFKNYIDYFYNIKCTSQDINKVLAKLFLNSLYGKFGMKNNLDIIKIIDNEDFIDILKNNEIISEVELNNNKTLIKYIPIKNIFDDNNERNFNISIGIASAVTAYARIIMNNYLTISDNLPYYTDTDSLYLSKPLPSSMVSSTELGKMKLEYHFYKAIFIAPKLYGLKLFDKTEIIKAKGTKSLTFNNLIELYKHKSIYVYEERWYKHLNQGTIEIKNKLLTISGILNKKIKIYKNGYWINTKPITINTEIKALVDERSSSINLKLIPYIKPQLNLIIYKY